jgi:hypothetical protein
MALVFLLSVTAFDCDKKGYRDQGEYRGSWSVKENVSTPLGARVGGENKPDPVLLPLVDEGLTELFRLSRQYNYDYGLYHGFWQVWLFPTSPKCINPAYTMRADGSPWDGTDFDKDPLPGRVLLCVAGMVVGENQMLVANAASHMALIVRYEGEHLVLLHNDRPKYEATAGVHAHPLITEIGGKKEAEASQYTFVGKGQLSPEMQKAVGDKHVCVALVK